MGKSAYGYPWKVKFVIVNNGMENMSVLDDVLQYLNTAKSILDTNPTAADYQSQIEAAYPSYGDASFVVLLMDNAGVFN